VETLLRKEFREKVRIAELGGGSGCIGISILQERPQWEWHAFELNPDSLRYLEENRKQNLPKEAAYHIHAGDFFELAPALAPFDWIVSNPPYVPGPDWDTLSREVRHEPRLALDAGPEGLDCLNRLVPVGYELLSTEGGFISEIESRQAVAVEALLNQSQFQEAEILKDWAGLDRIAFGRKV
jgi:release factor glutamine methyltransferase